jgi:hypothetical protein
MALARIKVGDRVALLAPLMDGYAGTGRVVAIGNAVVRFSRDDNHHEAIALRSEVRRVAEDRAA